MEETRSNPRHRASVEPAIQGRAPTLQSHWECFSTDSILPCFRETGGGHKDNRNGGDSNHSAFPLSQGTSPRCCRQSREAVCGKELVPSASGRGVILEGSKLMVAISECPSTLRAAGEGGLW